MIDLPEHYRVRCDCGRVISQCRCIHPGKVEIVVPKGCKVCKGEQPVRRQDV